MVEDNFIGADEDASMAELEQKYRAQDNGNAFEPAVFDPNSKTTETAAPVEGETKVIDGSGKDVTLESQPEAAPEDAEEQDAKAEIEAEHAEEAPAIEEKPAEKPKIRPWKELRQAKRREEALTNELEAEKQARRNFEERLRVIESRTQPVQQQRAPQQQVPEFTKDPLTNLDQRTDLTAREVQELKQRLQIQQLQQEINADETNYSRQQPDYIDARDFLINRELDRARLVFRALPEPQREQYAAAMVNQRRAILIATARESGQSVAQLAYDLAKGEGWDPLMAKNRTEGLATNGKVEAKPAPEKAREKVLAQKERNQQASASVGGLGKTPTPKKALTRADVMNMSEAEMDALDAQNPNWEAEVQD